MHIQISEQDADEFSSLKVPDLKARLRDLGKPVSGSKTVLIQRLRQAVQSTDENSVAEPDPSIPKAQYDEARVENALFDWSISILTKQVPATSDIQFEAMNAAPNHIDLNTVQKLLAVLVEADLGSISPPAVIETFAKIKSEVKGAFEGRQVTSQQFADLLRLLGAKVGLVQPNEAEHGATAGNFSGTSSINQAIRSWIASITENQDIILGTKYPANFRPAERKELMAWGRGFVEEKDLQYPFKVTEDLTGEAMGTDVPIERAKNKRTVDAILSEVCNKLRGAAKRKRKTAEKGQVQQLDEGSDYESDVETAVTVPESKTRRRTARVDAKDSDEDDEPGPSSRVPRNRRPILEDDDGADGEGSAG